MISELFRRRYTLPADLVTLLQTLVRAGYEAYAVGGGVRDMMLGRTPHDWDVTTSARPETVASVLRTAGYTVVPQVGEAFAVTLVRTPDAQYEVATFRGETYGADSHRPAEVYYAQTLEEDLARRDFTVNAMALTFDGRLHDPFGGKKDLRRKRLATVGAPAERFGEDALRVFRACRFVAQLDFLPTRELCAAIPAAFEKVRGLSMERVRAELEKLLLAPAPARGLDLLVRSGLAAESCTIRRNGTTQTTPILPELAHLTVTPQNPDFHAYDAWFHTLAVVQEIPATLTLRWAALFHDVAKGLPGIRGVHDGKWTDWGHAERGAKIALDVLRRFGYRDAFARRVAFLVRGHMRYHQYVNDAHSDPRRLLRRLARSGEFRTTAELGAALAELGELCCADVIGCGRPYGATDGHRAFMDYVAAALGSMPVHTSDLNYPQELPALLGAATGECLRALLQRVQDGQLQNKPDALLAAARRYMERKRRRRDEAQNKRQ